jgi:antitoxin HicB
MKKKVTSPRSVDDYMKLSYSIQLTPDEDLGWFADVRELPGCMSDGDSPDNAVKNLKEVMREWIAAALEDIGTIPLPACMQEYSGKFLVRTSPTLHQQLTEMADEQGISTNQLCAALLTAGVVGSTSKKQLEELESKAEETSRQLDSMMKVMMGQGLPVRHESNVIEMPHEWQARTGSGEVWKGEIQHAGN